MRRNARSHLARTSGGIFCTARAFSPRNVQCTVQASAMRPRGITAAPPAPMIPIAHVPRNTNDSRGIRPSFVRRRRGATSKADQPEHSNCTAERTQPLQVRTQNGGRNPAPLFGYKSVSAHSGWTRFGPQKLVPESGPLFGGDFSRRRTYSTACKDRQKYVDEVPHTHAKLQTGLCRHHCIRNPCTATDHAMCSALAWC